MANTDLLGYVYLREDVSPDAPTASNIQICDKPNIFYVEFDATLQSFGVMNRNHRVYNQSNVWSCIQNDEKIQDLMKNNSWFGEMDHPTPRLKNEELSPERIMNSIPGNTSHKIMNPYCKGNLINAHIQTDAGTEAGMNMAKKIIQGMVPRFSARALAELINKNGTPTVNMKKLITYDWVLYPSFSKAEMCGDATGSARSIPLMESGESDVLSSSDVFVPFEELAQDLEASDPNISAFMESGQFSHDDF